MCTNLTTSTTYTLIVYADRDPEGTRTDAELISALQRTWLLPKDGAHDAAAEAKFSLDSVVGDEGSNYSAGEKQMLALCRALAKNSRIIVLVSNIPSHALNTSHRCSLPSRTRRPVTWISPWTQSCNEQFKLNSLLLLFCASRTD